MIVGFGRADVRERLLNLVLSVMGFLGTLACGYLWFYALGLLLIRF